MTVEETKNYMRSIYGVNAKLTSDESYDRALAVKCHNGTFVGKEAEGVIAFKGIPYAKQPVGNLRWKKPERADDSDDVYQAYYYGHSSIQTEWQSEVASYYMQGEDCLNLNIWTAVADSSYDKEKKRPVMVFFHGGSYGWGGSCDPLYEGHNLVKKFPDVIVVTVDYRTGIMGFMDFSKVPGGKEFKASGNLGLLDHVASLEWIRDNIAGFGGDPDNVTIWGESAGGGTVSLLPLMRGTEGLFKKIIAESGSIALTSSREECYKLTEKLMIMSGYRNMKDLMNLTLDEIKEFNEGLNDYNNFPERDGIILPKNLYDAYKNGKAANVDMLIGTNKDEARYWMSEMGYYTSHVSGKTVYKAGIPIMFDNDRKRFIGDEMKNVATFLKQHKGGRTWKLTEFYNEVIFRLPATAQAEYSSDKGANVYMYYWKYPSAIPGRGACHAVELAYVFNNPHIQIYTGDNINDYLANEVQNMWVNFARCGNPSTKLHKWNSYDSKSRRVMILDANIHEEKDLLARQRKLLWPVLKYYIHGAYMDMSLNVPTVYLGVAALMVGLGASTMMVCKAVSMVLRRD